MLETLDRNAHWTARFRTRWCIAMHDSPMWPIHGEYECRTCGTHHLVPWNAERLTAAPAAAPVRLGYRF